VRDGDRDLLVRAEDDLGLVAGVVDERIVETAI
jgi:hypothetical protein